MIKNCIKIMWLVVLFAVASVYAQSKNEPIFTDSTKAIIVQKPNQEFDIVLKSNPTTGYSWELKKYDHKILAKVANKFYPPVHTNPPLVGAPGYEKWKFKVIDKNFFTSIHETSITMIYRRPWEKENQAAETIEFKVVTKYAN